MSDLSVDLPHKLGAAEARRRIEGGTDRIAAHMPSGAKVSHAWSGDRLDLDVAALGQAVTAHIEVRETLVRVSVTLPPALSFLRPMVELGVRRAGAELLEDKRPR